MSPALKSKKKVATKKKDAKPALKSSAPKTRVENAYKVIIRPIINEKTSLLTEQGKIVFLVDPAASKAAIKKLQRVCLRQKSNR
jgi:hypothetical protein